MGRDRHRVSTDIIIADGDSIVLIRRGQEPFRGMWCLPGGHVEEGEQVHEAAVREAKEETGLDIELTGLHGVYDEPGRDPRGPVITVVYTAEVVGGELDAETDADSAHRVDRDDLPDEMGFDHREILDDHLHDRHRL